jgi:hypothetical protein
MMYGAMILKIFIFKFSEAQEKWSRTTHKKYCHKERAENGYQPINWLQIE